MQQASVTCTRAAAFGTSCIIDIKWAALVQTQILYWHRWWWLRYCNLHCVVVVAVLFCSRAMAHILNACIETCTVWWWWRSFHLGMHAHVVAVIL